MKLGILGTVCLLAITTGPGFASDTDMEIKGNATKGEKTFRKCKACHEIGDGAKAKIGPVLSGVVGRPAGTMAGFSYSASLLEAAGNGLVWTPETLAEFLKKPKAFIDGTKMSFAGLRKEDERENVIAYLATFE